MPLKKIYTYPYFLFFLFAGLGIIVSFQYADGVLKNSGYFGPFTIGLFIPLIAAIFFLLASAVKPAQLNRSILLLTLLVFIISALPFLSVLNNAIVYADIDDGYRYSRSAHYMVEHKTLWGADGIVLKNESIRHYVFNPGYRYFLALELFIFGTETRGFQLFNLLLWVFIMCFFVRQLMISFREGFEKYLTLLFIAGTALYAPKNILMNLSEWLCVIWFILFYLSYINNKLMLAVIFLGLVVFTRQNLLFASFLLLFFTLKGKNIKQVSGHLLIYIFLLSLPLLHNLYYAGKWQWLPNYGTVVKNIFIPDSTGNMIYDILISCYRTSLHYILGVDPIFHNTRQNIFGIVFIPTGVALLVLLYRKMPATVRWSFVLQAVFVIGPSLVLNWAYFPRFEFINLYCLLITSLALGYYSNSFPARNDNYLPKLQ